MWGATDEFISSPRLDDLMCAYTSLQAFIARGNANAVTVYACFDNEEVGSGTKQGAASTLLADALSRINASLGYAPEDLCRALSASMLVSCDNAHALHPAHPELADTLARPQMNAGLVVKEAANQHYCTDAFSRAVLTAILDDAEIPHQCFSNRSDKAGGSTLGNISNMQVSSMRSMWAAPSSLCIPAWRPPRPRRRARDRGTGGVLRSGYLHRRGGGRRAGVARHRDAAAPSETPSPLATPSPPSATRLPSRCGCPPASRLADEVRRLWAFLLGKLDTSGAPGLERSQDPGHVAGELPHSP